MKATEINPEQLERCATMLKAIAHPTRIAIIELLGKQERLTVTEIYEQLGLEQAVASHHLSILKNKDVLTSVREGKNVLYELKYKRIQNVIECVQNCQDH